MESHVEGSNGHRRFVGIDLSLTETGLAIVDPYITAPVLAVIQAPRTLPTVDRQQFIVDKILRSLRKGDVCVFEMFGFAGKFSRSFKSIERIELSGMVKALSSQRTQERYIDVFPQTLKLFVSGKGNANKTLMVKILCSRWRIVTTNANAADAAGLALLGFFLVEGNDASLTVDGQPIRLSDAERAILDRERERNPFFKNFS